MDLSQLEIFLAVAREGSFSRAAEKLFRTQPAVSQAVRKLEAELGESLFDRSSRDGMLTDAGRVLMDYSHKLMNLRADAQVALKELREMQKGKLTIAANEFTCLYLLPVLAEFRTLYPTIKVEVHRSLASRIPDYVLSHGAEMGVLSFNPEEPRLRAIVVYSDELVFIVHPEHPLASAGQVSIRELGAESFVAHNVSSPYREKVLKAFKQYKTPLNMGVELPTIEAIKKFVAMGNGVALVPGICVESEIENGDLVRVQVRELNIERKLRIVHRKGASLSHTGRAFLKVAEMISNRKSRYLYTE
ncbi:MAG TPA: LysR family transcriptional regulator [Blastocatellia bacterium]|nr:LysR family transcriptional regulator [Blastocatellia bacterium]